MAHPKPRSGGFEDTFAVLGRLFVGALAALSFSSLVYFGYQFWSTQNPDFANAFTGAGAVLAAAISALVAFRTISIAEDAQKPYPYPYIDTQSRYGLSLLKLKNAGGSAAHHVYIDWNGEIPKLSQGGEDGRPINFASDDSRAIVVLMPGDEQSTPLGAHHWVAERLRSRDQELSGHVVFLDVKGRKHRIPFFLDTSFFQWALADETEALKAQYALSKIPDALTKMTRAIEQIGQERDHQ